MICQGRKPKLKIAPTSCYRCVESIDLGLGGRRWQLAAQQAPEILGPVQ